MSRVIAHGCFDCLHIGHIEHLRAARKLGSSLSIALTDDAGVGKGQGRPVFSWRERSDMLSALRFVDQTFQVRDLEHCLSFLTPDDIYVKGMDWFGKLPEQYRIEHEIGARVVFLDTLPVYSSTKILTGALLSERIRTARDGQE